MLGNFSPLVPCPCVFQLPPKETQTWTDTSLAVSLSPLQAIETSQLVADQPRLVFSQPSLSLSLSLSLSPSLVVWRSLRCRYRKTEPFSLSFFNCSWVIKLLFPFLQIALKVWERKSSVKVAIIISSSEVAAKHANSLLS